MRQRSRWTRPGRAYIAGNETQYCSSTTFKGCFPTTDNAVITGDKTGGGSAQYAFVAAFDPTGARLLYSSLFGSTDYACRNGCGAHLGHRCRRGRRRLLLPDRAKPRPRSSPPPRAWSSRPPDRSIPPAAYIMSYRGFAAKFRPVTATPTLAWCTYLGGHTSNTSDYLSGIAVDGAGNTYPGRLYELARLPGDCRRPRPILRGQFHLLGGACHQVEPDGHLHPVVHLRRPRQARRERCHDLYRPHPAGRRRQRVSDRPNRRDGLRARESGRARANQRFGAGAGSRTRPCRRKDAVLFHPGLQRAQHRQSGGTGRGCGGQYLRGRQ